LAFYDALEDAVDVVWKGREISGLTIRDWTNEEQPEKKVQWYRDVVKRGNTYTEHDYESSENQTIKYGGLRRAIYRSLSILCSALAKFLEIACVLADIYYLPDAICGSVILQKIRFEKQSNRFLDKSNDVFVKQKPKEGKGKSSWVKKVGKNIVIDDGKGRLL